MNIPVTQAEMQAFKLDPTQQRIGGKTFIRMDENGKPIYYPNGQERRQMNKSVGSINIIKNNRKTTNGRKTIILRDKTVDIRIEKDKFNLDKTVKYISTKVKAIFKQGTREHIK